MIDAYQEFLARKAVVDPHTGIDEPGDMPSAMMGHQSDITRWGLRRGRSAIFAGTGLGKTFMELTWADRVARHTNRPVLVYAPLAVSVQHKREADKWDIEARIVRRNDDLRVGVNIANYGKLDHFDHASLGGISLDESSILKNYQGKTRGRLIEECQTVPFRLAATATPAPNDYMELGNHAEFLGVMSYTDMLATFFVHDGGDTQKWRLKGHAENAFWKWMSSWAVMLRKPSDLGYSDDGYDLPPLTQVQHTVAATDGPNFEMGTLFPMAAESMSERISVRRSTVSDRVDRAAQITADASATDPFMWWCNLNSEADALCEAIPGCVQISGSEKDEAKEEKVLDFITGRLRVMTTKPTVAGYGMNFQHCCNTGFVGLNDSFEQIYQAVRRFWRFGQARPVTAHFIASELEGAVVANIRRKEVDAERMAAGMVAHMADLSAAEVRGSTRNRGEYNPTKKMELPQWI